MMRFFTFISALLVLADGRKLVMKKRHDYSVNTSVKIDGESIGEGNQLNDATGQCVTNSNDKFSEVTVCGCEVKIEAHLMTRCEAYHQYSETIGECDCGKSGCVTKKLTHGRPSSTEGESAGHPLNAMSYKVVGCN